MVLSIGRKINLLLVTMLLLTGGGIILTATDLFTSDLSHLISKGALDAAAMLSSRARSELRHVASRAFTLGMASLQEFRYPADRLQFIEESLKRDPQLASLALYANESPSDQPPRFRPRWRAIRRDLVAQGALSSRSLEAFDREFPVDFEVARKGEASFRLASLQPVGLVIRMAIPFLWKAKGEFTEVLVVEMRQDAFSALLEDSTGYAGLIVDGKGQVLGSADPLSFPPGEDLSDLPLLAPLLAGRAPAMQREFTDRSGLRRIGAFQKVGFGGLAAIAQVPFDHAERAMRELYLRSLFLAGALLSLALLISFLLSRAISDPLRALSAAADRIATGDFAARVSIRGRGRDELGLLGTSFNTMAGKIGELIQQTAQKARMEKELETARIVQRRFFPGEDLATPRFRLAGSLLPASECGGDWWHYAKLGDHLIVAMGDVTGHGVSAALVTAAAHAAFSLCVERVRDGIADPEAWLRGLARELEVAIRAAGAGQAGMTLVASVIDTGSGRAVSFNAAHRPPLLLRARACAAGGADKAFGTLVPAGGPGMGEGYSATLSETWLEPGDLVLWYTDGLVECTDPTGRPLSKVEFRSRLLELVSRDSGDVRKICDALMAGVREFTGRAEVEDDITIVVGQVGQVSGPGA
ncbi:MAG: SpoIIE family protein phosphatase [Oligoflexia bacterium]|nr:SpoIIE family protein phosphatase [Oligoflexia bacterium]